MSYTCGVSQFHKGHLPHPAAAMWSGLPKRLEGPVHGVDLGRSWMLSADHLGEVGSSGLKLAVREQIRVRETCLRGSLDTEPWGTLGRWALPLSSTAGDFGKIPLPL